jgi:sarcosine oxidase subunit beta
MKRTADVIVIGGGIHGCSTALHLALRGMKPLVIEKDYAGRHASGVNAGGVRQLARHVAEVPLSVASMELWERIGDLVDDDCGFESNGQVLVAESEAELVQFRARVDDLRMRGYTHEELIERAELKRLVPAVSDACPGGVVSRRDGAADPFRTTQAFRRKAVALGATVIEGVRVTELARRGGTWHVATSAGDFEAPIVVNAAGAWADRIAAALGEPVALEVMALMLMITSRVQPFIEPVVILRSRKLSFKQRANGTVLIGGGYQGRANRDTNATEIDWGKLAESARTVWELFPAMRGAEIVRAWAGIEARMPDDIPVIGPSSKAEGVYHQFGFCGHGFQLGPGVGALMAELITTGNTNLPIQPFSIARFARA